MYIETVVVKKQCCRSGSAFSLVGLIRIRIGIGNTDTDTDPDPGGPK
jgi:hypothetical protein